MKIFKNEDDYKVDLELKIVLLIDEGIKKVEKYFNLKNFYDLENIVLIYYLD